jgi:hypothetical protein
MQPLNLQLEGSLVPLFPAAQSEQGEIWIPLQPFCAVAGILCKQIGPDGELAVCDDEAGDVCVPLNIHDTQKLDGELFARLQSFADPLGITFSLSGDMLSVTHGTPTVSTGFAIGQRPPRFELPDVSSGKLVSSDVYYDKPAVFYMWASW